MAVLPPYSESYGESYAPPPPAYGYKPPTQYGFDATVYPAPPVYPTVVQVQSFRDLPVRCRCPNCAHEVTTRTSYEVGAITWVSAAVVAAFGCLLCAWIPCFLNETKDVVHTCPVCKKVVSVYRRLTM